MVVHSPEKFSQATKALAEGDTSPYVKVAQAQRSMESTDLHALAFGIIGAMFIKGTYDDSREFLTKNLKTGTTNFGNIIGDLNNIAKAYHGAEQANVVDSSKIDPPKVVPTDGNADNYGESAVQSSAWFLGIAALAGETVMAGCAKLAISAGIATIAWAMFMPDDAALSKAHGHWTAAGSALAGFDDTLQSTIAKFGEAWDDSTAKDAFIKYIERFSAEIDECKAAVDAGAGALQTIHNGLNTQQWMWFGVAIANLVVLIFCQIAQAAFPPTAPIWKGIAEGIGAVFSLGVSSWVAQIAGYLFKGYLATQALSTAAFVTEKAKSKDGNGIDFTDVENLQHEGKKASGLITAANA